MNITTITKDNFRQEVLQSSKPVLVDFWASWCVPCKMLAPMIQQIADEMPELKVCKINIDEEMSLAQDYQVMSIPTLILFKNGQVSARTMGNMPKQMIKQELGL